MKKTIGVMLSGLLKDNDVKIQRWGDAGYEVIVSNTKTHTHYEHETITGAIGKAHSAMVKAREGSGGE